MNGGRDRLDIGTYGDINTTRTPAGTVRAEARYRDWDGEVRKVTATASTEKTAKQALRKKLGRRSTVTGLGTTLSPGSTVAELAAAWLDDVRIRTDLADGTKDLYRRELNSLVLPTFKGFLLREVTVGRVDQFLKRQATVSYAYARHSRVVLSLMFNYALRHDAVVQNPIVGVAPLRHPGATPERSPSTRSTGCGGPQRSGAPAGRCTAQRRTGRYKSSSRCCWAPATASAKHSPCESATSTTPAGGSADRCGSPSQALSSS